MIALLLFGGVAFAATETATVTLKTSIGETPANSGIRLTTTTPVLGDIGFDAGFAAATTILMLDHTAQNSEVDNVNGTFLVLIKRGADTALTVNITANPLKNLAHSAHVPYTLTPTTGTPLTIATTPVAGTYQATTTLGSLMRHANTFTYDIPVVGASSFYGVYSGDIVFEVVFP